MASKYTFLTAWANKFLAALTKLEESDKRLEIMDETRKRTGASGGSERFLTSKRRDKEIQEVFNISKTLSGEFMKNGVPSSESGPILAGLDALITNTDLKISVNVTNIIAFVQTYLSPQTNPIPPVNRTRR